MIDIAKLIALHDRHSCANALPHSLGDGYLYTHNKVFANVRNVVQAQGVRLQPSVHKPLARLQRPSAPLPAIDP